MLSDVPILSSLSPRRSSPRICTATLADRRKFFFPPSRFRGPLPAQAFFFQNFSLQFDASQGDTMTLRTHRVSSMTIIRLASASARALRRTPGFLGRRISLEFSSLFSAESVPACLLACLLTSPVQQIRHLSERPLISSSIFCSADFPGNTHSPGV